MRFSVYVRLRTCAQYASMSEYRRVFDVWHMWRLATHDSEDYQKQLADFQKSSTDFQLTVRIFAHSAETFCLAPCEQQDKYAPAARYVYVEKTQHCKSTLTIVSNLHENTEVYRPSGQY